MTGPTNQYLLLFATFHQQETNSRGSLAGAWVVAGNKTINCDDLNQSVNEQNNIHHP